MPKISIVMTAYKRAPQLRKTLESIRSQSYSDYEIIVVEDGYDGGATLDTCAEFGTKYYQRKRRPGLNYSNPAVPMNIGIKRAEGEIIILQNAECRHVSLDTIERFSSIPKDEAHFATVMALTPVGAPDIYYCHPTLRREPWFFCGAVHKEHLWRMRGVDEDYIHYGMDDVDLADRLVACGVKFVWTDIEVEHQWHETYHETNDYHTNGLLYQQKKALFTIERNPIGWGEIE